jgi:hypothetical protein
MKNIILALTLLVSVNVFAASGSGNVSNVITMGGNNTADNLVIPEANTQGYFSLYSTPAGAAAAGTMGVFYKNGTPYQVTAGKTCKVVKVYFYSSNASSNQFQFVSATASFANGASTASLTGPIYQGGAAGNYVFSNPNTQFVSSTYSANYDFPASSYVGYVGGTGGLLIILLAKEI